MGVQNTAQYARILNSKLQEKWIEGDEQVQPFTTAAAPSGTGGQETPILQIGADIRGRTCIYQTLMAEPVGFPGFRKGHMKSVVVQLLAPAPVRWMKGTELHVVPGTAAARYTVLCLVNNEKVVVLTTAPMSLQFISIIRIQMVNSYLRGATLWSGRLCSSPHICWMGP